MKAKTLVTGGAGFIGSWLCKILADKSIQVLAFDDLSTGEASNLKGIEGVELIEGSVSQAKDLDKLPWEQIQAVYHLAAKGDVQESIDDPMLYTEVNVLGTQLVLEQCREHNIPILVMSTCMVYGFEAHLDAQKEGISESFPTLPISPYGASKLAAEQIAISYHHSYGLPVKIARPFNTYGPHQKTNNREGGVIPIFLDRKIKGETLHIFGDGTQSRDFLYVRDCAEFLVKFMQSSESPMILNAGSDTTVTITHLAESVSQKALEIEYVEHPHPQSEIHCLLCDSSQARKNLDWYPRTSLTQGLDENLAWLKEQA